MLGWRGTWTFGGCRTWCTQWIWCFWVISATPGGCHKFHSAPGVPWLCSKVSPLMDHILFRICLSKSFRPSCPSLWQKWGINSNNLGCYWSNWAEPLAASREEGVKREGGWWVHGQVKSQTKQEGFSQFGLGIIPFFWEINPLCGVQGQRTELREMIFLLPVMGGELALPSLSPWEGKAELSKDFEAFPKSPHPELGWNPDGI